MSCLWWKTLYHTAHLWALTILVIVLYLYLTHCVLSLHKRVLYDVIQLLQQEDYAHWLNYWIHTKLLEQKQKRIIKNPKWINWRYVLNTERDKLLKERELTSHEVPSKRHGKSVRKNIKRNWTIKSEIWKRFVKVWSLCSLCVRAFTVDMDRVLWI